VPSQHLLGAMSI